MADDSLDKFDQKLLWKPKHEKAHRMVHGVASNGFVIKMMGKETAIDNYTQIVGWGRRHAYIEDNDDPFELKHYFIQYSLNKKNRWEIQDDIGKIDKVQMDPIRNQAITSYRVRCLRTSGFNWGSNYTNVNDLSEGFKHARIQEYNHIGDDGYVISTKGNNLTRKSLLSTIPEPDEAVIPKIPKRLPRRNHHNIKDANPHLHTQYVLMEYTDSLGVQNRPRSYGDHRWKSAVKLESYKAWREYARVVRNWDSTGYGDEPTVDEYLSYWIDPEAEATVEIVELSGDTEDSEALGFELIDSNDSDSEVEDDTTPVALAVRKPITLADFIPNGVQETRKHRKKSSSWSFV